MSGLTLAQVESLEVGDIIRLIDHGVELPLHSTRELIVDGCPVTALVVDVGGGELHNWNPEDCELVSRKRKTVKIFLDEFNVNLIDEKETHEPGPYAYVVKTDKGTYPLSIKALNELKEHPDYPHVTVQTEDGSLTYDLTEVQDIDDYLKD